MLLKDAVTEFLQYLIVELNRSPSTQRSYTNDLSVFMSFLETNKQERLTLQELTPEILSDYARYLTRECGTGTFCLPHFLK